MLKSWMVIGVITFGLAIALGSLVSPRGTQWFRRLRRPDWLTFEWAIPLIWTTIFTCGAISASQVWDTEPGSSRTWGLMALYLVLELVTLAYTPVMLWLRRLRVGVWIGATGFVVAIVLTLIVLPIASSAAYLLVPYLLWSPIGTYVTWDMMRLNPGDG
ncbi:MULTISPECIES: TspO/MBR family protein [unclassified Leptolyngbya]|uniref:TspO/MBR family protein n=1 Tax=unclassified Leptolyngbya TaxID=2650499 RepID=UPI0016874284|nr:MULTISPECIES: TspO/MBR family protein [unclassified Leptolyngbya]MBD1911062.1 TspO/MBR family protein [Leptolyngbya sp. FACHB-8]MBD2158272.1 TspO/MBR family protein [Leptolyngbya sp. FACHB-16]